jgi:hypothetical protein
MRKNPQEVIQTTSKNKKRVCPILTLEGKKRTDTILLDLSDNQHTRSIQKRPAAVTSRMIPSIINHPSSITHKQKKKKARKKLRAALSPREMSCRNTLVLFLSF